MMQSEISESLRPRFMMSRPVSIPSVFPDPEHIIDIVKQRAPYLNVAEFHNHRGTTVASKPWFRSLFTDDLFLNNESFIAGAKEAFAATVVKPTSCFINIFGPMERGGIHLDLTHYRGVDAWKAPNWLIHYMTHSGLFKDWVVPIATGLTWYYAGEGGEFRYWPEGSDGPCEVVPSPMWNNGIVSDNEILWHEVGEVGREQDREFLKGAFQPGDQLHYRGDDWWEIRRGETPIFKLPTAEVRISLLWKARIFFDDEHAASFEDPRFDLALDTVLDLFAEDFARRGIECHRPEDPLNDLAWREVVERTYPRPVFAGGPN